MWAFGMEAERMPQGIELSNLDKVYWPAHDASPAVSKGDLIAYVDEMAPALLPVLKDRPLTVIRYPDGIEKGSFYQKDTPKYAPEWIRTVTLHASQAKRDVRYPLCNDRRTLRWLANQASIELHPWLSRVDRLERPDALVFDLDPPEGGFERTVPVALMVRELLRDSGLQAVAKTSGSKGIHVWAPLQRRYDYRTVRRAADRLATRLAAEAGDEVTTEFLKAGRGGRVYLDTGRLAPGAHMASVYSPRARPGAPVSFPVPWDELSRVAPLDFTIATVPDLVRRGGDPWKALMPPPQRLPEDLLAD
jgi:DNA ligase D